VSCQSSEKTPPDGVFSPIIHERDEIVRILKVTHGRVAGPDGAAARLDLKRTTLISRMKRLGIDPQRVL